MKNILTIAGYDPSSGAGLARDLDVFFSMGIHGLSAPTCTVVQGPKGVTGVYPTPMKVFKHILADIEKDVIVHGVKMGVLCDKPYIDATVAYIKQRDRIPVIIDPVFSAKNDVKLLADEALTPLIEKIFPLATAVTPNINEAARICAMPIKNRGHMHEAAEMIHAMGPRIVIIKGGHLKGDPEDVCFDGNEFYSWERKRIRRQIHGTGCTFSSLLTAFFVVGYKADDAFFAAEEAMERQLASSYRMGGAKGYYYLSSAAVHQEHAREGARQRGLMKRVNEE